MFESLFSHVLTPLSSAFAVVYFCDFPIKQQALRTEVLSLSPLWTCTQLPTAIYTYMFFPTLFSVEKKLESLQMISNMELEKMCK